MRMLRHVFLIGIFLCMAEPAFAIYKCEDAGKVSYSDIPCASAIEIGTDRLDPLEAKRAHKQAAEEKKMLGRLETEERKNVRKQEGDRRRIAKSEASRENRCKTLERRRKWANEDSHLASVKTEAKAKRKARRAAEQYEQECSDRNRQGLGYSG